MLGVLSVSQSKAAAARQTARARANRFLERENRLVDVAARFAEAEEKLQASRATFDKKRRDLDAQQEQEETTFRLQESQAARVMVHELGVPRAQAAERLGVTSRQLRAILARTDDETDKQETPQSPEQDNGAGEQEESQSPGQDDDSGQQTESF